MAVVTPFQTVGPFFDFGLVIRRRRHRRDPGPPTACTSWSTERSATAPAIRCRTRIVEVWQANAAGRYRHPADERRTPLDPACDGFGRVATIADGRFEFATVMPGRVAAPDGRRQAPHLLVSVLARGILTRLATRDLLRGRSGQRRRSSAAAGARAPARHAGGAPGRGESVSCSTSCSRDPARRCSSMSETGRAVAAVFADTGRVQRMLDVEAALAKAEAAAGIVPADRRERHRTRGAGGADRRRGPARRRPGRRQPRHPAGQAAHPTGRRGRSGRGPLRALGRDEPGHHRHRPRPPAPRRRSARRARSAPRPQRRRPTTRAATRARRWPGAPGSSRRRRSPSG